jgi:hypothetical protein
MFHNQQISERKSVWEVVETMPTASEIANPSAYGSQIYPQYSPANHQMQQYRQAWTSEANQAKQPDEIKTTKNK